MERGEGIRRGAENPFSDIGPQRGPYFLVFVIESSIVEDVKT